MRMCVKCSKMVSGDSKICRDCGAILEGVPNDSVSGTSSESTPGSQRGSSWPAQSQETRQEEGDEQSAGEEAAETDGSPPADIEASAWKCSRCGESVPGTFDMCWKCLTAESEPALSPEDPDAGKPDEGLEPADFRAEPLGPREDKGKRPPQVCPRCGSAKMMRGVSVQSKAELGSSLQVVICGDPSALIFKDRLYGELKATICGHCGHVELRVRNAKKLYRHYRRSSR